MTDSTSAEQRLDRVFHDADEMIFTAANADTKSEKEAAAKEVYSGLVQIHQNYHRLFVAYEEIGKFENQTLDINDRIQDQEQYDTAKKMESLKKFVLYYLNHITICFPISTGITMP